MANDIDETRKHLLWSVDWELNQLKKEAGRLKEIKASSGWFVIRMWASMRLESLAPTVLWWGSVKAAIESDRAEQALPALESLIRHFQPALSFLRWVAPLSPRYWEFGLGPLATSRVAEIIREATELSDHYRQRAV